MVARGARIVASAVAAALLSGCASTLQVVADSSLAVGVSAPFMGVNPVLEGASVVDLGVQAATLSGFAYVDARGEVVEDVSFGSMRVLDESPLTVRYTVADGLAWSDGAAVDAVDLLLDWAARSGDEVPDGDVLEHAERAVLSADRKSLTVTFDGEAQWQLAFPAPMAAHVAAERAFGEADGERAKDAVVAAVEEAEEGSLADLDRLIAAWLEMSPADGVSSGPYRVDAVTVDRVELEWNPTYRGDRQPMVEEFEILSISEPAAAVHALEVGVVQAVQIGWAESSEEAIAGLRGRTATIPDAAHPSWLVGWYAREVTGVDPRADGPGLLWNLWAWSAGSSQQVE